MKKDALRRCNRSYGSWVNDRKGNWLLCRIFYAWIYEPSSRKGYPLPIGSPFNKGRRKRDLETHPGLPFSEKIIQAIVKRMPFTEFCDGPIMQEIFSLWEKISS